jgi:hypothetical protein
MTLVVVGAGLVSPAGRTPEEHAFFLRARAAPPPRSPFLLESGDPIDVRFCPWISARESVAERLCALATRALASALLPIADPLLVARAPLLLCTPATRAGLSDADRDLVAAEALRASGAGSQVRFTGAAGTFAALARAQAMIERGDARAAIVLAVDSYVAIDALAWDVSHPRGPWSDPRWPRGEGAAALVVVRKGTARGAGASVLGTIVGAATKLGTSTDDDDEAVDGAAMTDVLRGLAGTGKVRLAFGQSMIDSLRRREWYAAVARLSSRFDVACEHRGIEDDVGDVGAASGAMNIALALATMAHDTGAAPNMGDGGVLVWAISKDGTRGAAAVTGAA